LRRWYNPKEPNCHWVLSLSKVSMKKSQILPSVLFAAFLSSSPLLAQCESTIFATNNSLTASGSTVYLDLIAASSVSISSIEINSPASAGTAIGIEVWTKVGTYDGSITDPAAWTLAAVDDGTALAMGSNTPSPITLMTPLDLPAGTTGIALVGVGTGHAYTNGTGANQTYFGANLTIEAGASTAAAFTGNIYTPRVFNGTFCVSSTATGTTFCDTMPPNSTGVATELAGAMTAPGGSGLHLEATSGPAGEFGFFLIGTAPMDPGLPTGNGFLCLDPGGASIFHGYSVAGGDQNSIGIFDASGILQNLAGTSSTGTGFDVPSTIPITPVSSIVIVAGSTFHFQVWHRDTPAGSGQSNLSNGLSVTF
jgi:hypothetical protein